MIVLRSAIFQVLFYLWTVVAGTVFLPFLLCPRRAFVPAGRLWCRGVMWLLRVTVGLSYRVEGTDRIPEGPVIFAQERYGLNRRRFRMLKFTPKAGPPAQTRPKPAMNQDTAFYWDGLGGEKSVLYVPNEGHGIAGDEDRFGLLELGDQAHRDHREPRRRLHRPRERHLIARTRRKVLGGREAAARHVDRAAAARFERARKGDCLLLDGVVEEAGDDLVLGAAVFGHQRGDRHQVDHVRDVGALADLVLVELVSEVERAIEPCGVSHRDLVTT